MLLASQHNQQLELPAPEPLFLKIREVVANVLHAVGRANENIEPVPDTEGFSGRVLASDGSTNVENVLWTGKLALLPASRHGSSPRTQEQKPRHQERPMISVTENDHPCPKY